MYSLKIAFRSFVKQGVFSFVNVLSLSIGLSVVLLISLMIFNEYSFDKSFKVHKNIYRINSYLLKWQPGTTFCTTANAVGPAMEEAIPAVKSTVRIYPMDFMIKVGDNLFKVEDFCWADEDFFNLFDTPFLYGSADEALLNPNTVAISEKMANKLFGDKNPVGETFLLDNQVLMEVGTVYKDFPENSSFASFQIVGPFKHSYPSWLHREIHWGNIDFETFCLLSENVNIPVIEQQMKEVASKETREDCFYNPSLQRLDLIHLNSGGFIHTNLSNPSDIKKVRMLILLATIVLLIACVNYMNLSTARAQKRSREIGISKTLGAKRKCLIVRLFAETTVITFGAFVIAFIISYLLLSVFNDLLAENLSWKMALNPIFVLSALLIFVITTMLAASYPAIYLSGFPPLLAIRQVVSTPKSKHAIVRKILIVAQFAVAIILISWVIVIHAQIQFISNIFIGYNPHNITGISLSVSMKEADINALKNAYQSQSLVEETALSQAFPFNVGSGNSVYRSPEDQNGLPLWTSSASPELVKLLDIKLIAGSYFTAEKARTDTITKIIINRKVADYLEISPDEIIGKEIMANIGSANDPHVVVCGVVEDFNSEDLYRPIVGYGFHNGIREKSYLLLRTKEGYVSQQLQAYEQIFKKHFPNYLFEVHFLDVELRKSYESERRTNRIAACFSVLAIFVACLGVFGLTAFMAEQRTKEIGIRKVMGAGVKDIVALFTNDYLKLLLISLVIAIPVAWWIGSNYLQDFAYRITLSWWIFALAASITVVLTLLTVCYQAVKTAMSNPVTSIQTE